MPWFLQLILLVLSLILAESQEQQVVPTHYDFSTLGIRTVNGSSSTGGCSSISAPNLDGTSRCNAPSSAVLFDGYIPTLTELNGDTWADQLMVLGPPEYGPSSNRITAHIGPFMTVRQIEITVFTCPQWWTGVRYISIFYSTSTARSEGFSYLTGAQPTVYSCDSLITVCIPFPVINARQIRLSFGGFSAHKHIAEIAFYANSSPCPAFTIIPGNWTAPNATEVVSSVAGVSLSTTEDSDSLNSQASAGEGLLKEIRPILSVLSVLAALITLQTVVFFIVSVMVAYKYCRKKQKISEKHLKRRQECPKEMLEHPQSDIKDKKKFEDEEDEVYEMVDDQPENKPPKPPVRKKRVHYMNITYS